ncbi:hypothetical protein [Janibacter cremeus]|uniref:Uncharacterized protein n=1 Tax=Janibacter cremeus TaxID=1285192 RepID=A0A852VLJ9_9MICO|nr:hypothetical protein [Janibacter cremeus]NYF97902.1 hypothetical protein [Janibacter cremeus]
MSAMPPPPPSDGGEASGFQPAPEFAAPGGSGPVMTTAPPSIVRAKYAMWAGAVLQLITILTSFVGMGDMRAQVREELDRQGVSYTDNTVDAAVALGIGFSVFVGVVGVILWVLMAWLNGKGKSWARVVATVLFAFYIISFLISLAQPTQALTLVISLLVLIAGAAATFFLWQKDSTAWFRAHKRV